MNSEVCWPGPPRRATSTPGTKRSASPRSARAGAAVRRRGSVRRSRALRRRDFGARRGDDDGFEGRAAGGSGKQVSVCSSVLLPSGESRVHRSRRHRRGEGRTPAPPVARRDWRMLTGRSPDSRRVPRDPPHRLPTGDSGSGCRLACVMRLAPFTVAGAVPGWRATRAPASRLARARARDTCHRGPFWAGASGRSSRR